MSKGGRSAMSQSTDRQRQHHHYNPSSSHSLPAPGMYSTKTQIHNSNSCLKPFRDDKTHDYPVPGASRIVTSYGFDIYVYSGDITKSGAEAITTGEGTEIGGTSQVTRALSKVLPSEFMEQRHQLFTNERGTLIKGYVYSTVVTMTSSTNKHILHAVVPFYEKGSKTSWKDQMTALYETVCKVSDEIKIESVAIPLLGTGQGEGCMQESIQAAASGLYKYAEQIDLKIQACLKEVHMVVFKEDLKAALVHEIKKCFLALRKHTDINVPLVGKEETYTTVGKTENVNNDSSLRRPMMDIGDPEPGKNQIQDHRSSSRLDCNKDEACGNSTLSERNRSKDPPTYTDKAKAETNTKKEPTDKSEDCCPICMDKMTDPKVLDKCEHVFCRHCIDTSFKKDKPVCPSCQTTYGEVTGNMPKDGKMEVQIDEHHSVPGYERYGTIIIHYSFLDGIQTAEHPNPGVRYRGTSRTAYLPDSPEGRKVLSLLKVAWKRQLTFTVGRSTTTGRDNVVTWNDIHHKTNLTGGESHFGYPDDTYLSRMTEELASKGVTEGEPDKNIIEEI